MLTFKEIGIDKRILKTLEEIGFEQPTAVQEKVIPMLNQDENSDLIALAQTGTGKTAAFGLPLIQRTDTSKKHIQYLILSPTRELCLQIADDLNQYAQNISEIKIGALFGGSSLERQISLLKKGVHIVSATPGRLVDLINRKKIDLKKVKGLVLDEADEMLNMGFKDELEAILKTLTERKQTLLFSATMLKEVRAIAQNYMKNPIEITIGKKNAGAENVNHICYTVNARERYLALKRIVDFNPNIYGIIFCRTRRETQEVADNLIKDGYNAEALHGDLSQQQRSVVMNKFKIKHLTLLVATDVAARGLDVNSLSHVINYNLPDDLEIYTHRSGRTGRAGKKGTSIIIANLKEKRKIENIEKLIGKKFERAQIPLGKDICKNQLFYLIDRMEKVIVDDKQIEAFLPIINKKLEWLDRDELIKKFVSLEFNRFIEYYKKMPDLNTPAERRKGEKRKGFNERGKNIPLSRFFLNLGKKDKLKPTDVIGMVNDYTGIGDIEIGDIEILDNFSFFEAEKEHEQTLMTSFKKKNFRKRTISLEVAQQESRKKKKSLRGKKRTDSKPKTEGKKRKSGKRRRR